MLYYDYMEEQRNKNKLKKTLKYIFACLSCILVLFGSFFVTYSILISNHEKKQIIANTNMIINTVIDNTMLTDDVIVNSNNEEVSKNVETKNNENTQNNVEEVPTYPLPKVDETTQDRIIDIYYSDEKQVYLTFDDGPSQITPQILDILKENNVKATFFVLGSRIELNPSILKRAYNEGHYIANHGYSHVYSSIYEQPENVLDEYYKTEQLIKDAIENPNYESHFFRFPGGSSGRTL